MVSKYEIRAKKELEAEGWRVDDKRGMSRFSKNRDFFNLFDLVAIRADMPYIRWISIKGHQGIPKEHLAEVEKFYLPPGNVKEIWYWPRTKSPEWNKRTLSTI